MAGRAGGWTFVVISALVLNLTFDGAEGELSLPVLPLHKILAFMDRFPDKMNTDSIFGVVIVEAQLRQASAKLELHRLSNTQVAQNISLLIKKAISVQESSKQSLVFNTENEDIISQVAFDPYLWGSPYKQTGFRYTPLQWTTSQVIYSIYKGHPHEPESDFCIAGVTKGYNPMTHNMTSPCFADSDCVHMMTTGAASGYPLTHRLLYFMMAHRVGCAKAFAPNLKLQRVQRSLCNSVLSETIASFNVGVPSAAWDLFIEQILLCGLNGYEQFVQPQFLDLILTWQHPTSGCYGPGLPRLRVKRAANYMAGECVNHITGLAAAAMALYIRVYIDGYLEAATSDRQYDDLTLSNAFDYYFQF